MATADDTIGARETATVGIKQIYSPMVDVSHEPRWGRIVEGAGEDPYLGVCVCGRAGQGRPGHRLLRAGQGRRERQALSPRTASPRAVASTTPPTCPSSGCATSTCRRSRPRSTPAPTPRCARSTRSTASRDAPTHETETDILKHEWGFDGFIESDYTAVAELRACPPKNPDSGPCGHGVAADGPDAAQAALNAGTDMEMVSTNIRDFGKQLLAQHRISMARLNDAVRRILRVKFRAGLFDHPYVDQAKADAIRTAS